MPQDRTASPWHVVVEFVGVDLDDDVVLDALLVDTQHDILWSSIDDVTTADATIDIDTAEEAVLALTELVSRAVPAAQLLRVVDPLVAIPDIAEHAGVTRQAVRNWATGQRHSGFPLPVAIVGDGIRVWRLADVDRWLADNVDLGSGRRYLTVLEVAVHNDRVSGDVGDNWTIAYSESAVLKATPLRAAADVPEPSRIRSAGFTSA